MHPRRADIEDRLRIILDTLDSYLEDKYAGQFPLHPNRLKRGEASSPSYDGLFSVHAKFSLGYGSPTGRGYDVVIDISTLSAVPAKFRAAMEEDAAAFLNRIIPDYFPERKLEVTRDNLVYKITGDFSLGTA